MKLNRLFANLPVATKLACIVGMSLVSALTIGLLAIVRLLQLEHTTREIAAGPLPKSATLGEIEIYVRQARTRAFQHCLESDDKGWSKFERQTGESLAHAQECLDRYDQIEKDPHARLTLETFKSSWAEYCNLNAQALPLSRQGKFKEALALLNGPMKKLIDGPVELSLTELLHTSQKQGGLWLNRPRKSAK